MSQNVYRWRNGGGLVLGRFPPTVQQLRAMIGPTPVVYRVEDDRTSEWREPTGAERLKVRAWLDRKAHV